MSNEQFIEIVNDRENNLKNVSLKIPKNKITVFTGVSGSGKSSIVFDTIAQEAGRQLNSTYSSFTRLYLPKYKRPDADEIHNLTTAIIIDQKPLGGNARSILGTISDINPLFRILFSRFGKPKYGDASNAFSFNDPMGMCPKCDGVGKSYVLKMDAALDMDKTLSTGAIKLPGYTTKTSFYLQTILNSGMFDNDKPIKDFSEEEMEMLLNGEESLKVEFNGAERNITYEGIERQFYRRNFQTGGDLSSTARKNLEKFAEMATCNECHGMRYNKKVLASKIDGKNIFDLTNMQLDELLKELDKFNRDQMQSIVKDIKKRVGDLVDIGLDYLSLTRETTSLSGGESQRVKTVKYLSNSLTGLTYILDEPSTGLHPRDVHRLNDLLMKLRDNGNTVLVVEHDPDVIKIADHIIDVGPRAGIHGGEIMYTGSYDNLLKSDTLTGKYLQNHLPFNDSPREANDFIESSASSLHNLKNVSLKIPKGLFSVITGVAGSGKSTLVEQVFSKEYPDAVIIDQSPLHATSRSNSATYTGIMAEIRKLFAKANDVSDGLFSYNSTGACPECGGKGVIEMNLSFMENSEIECPVCHGGRYDPKVLEYKLKDKNIVEIMNMTIEEAVDFFDDKKISSKLSHIQDVGLDYLSMGQPLNTLSGGECQRLKIAKELNKKGNVFILDEPTTGLHVSDIENIIRIINNLVDKGNTVIVIEHNTDVMRSADWIVDMGPDGGSRGGQILYEGQVAGIKKVKESYTAEYLF
ncbi:ATP-binding cassette domain-containing protein [Companilactobacillus mishanensis]|uniref:UvrABC system protein A n=1 Tax=Companilactobacillus mishanensis TaxID=2486008 RepID=A0ABW9P904_9LACO|nr:excinuclease ABC subunit UvrA [Companilactobacillus mishanensis]MQS45765.1 excinuclease ABC subunit UvrA [Companilactobacillus mishanensis]